MKIYQKIAKAKEEIKASKIKKGGRNDFSKYDYFTPEQVETMVFDACKNNGLITKFDLKRNEFGETAYLTITDIDTAEKEVYEMSTAIPSITATNIAQQLGGCVTYSERYLKMSAFGIVENALDFDDKNNSKPSKVKDDKPWLNPKTEQWEKAVKYLKDGNGTIKEIEKKYKIGKENKELLIDEAI